MGFCWGMEVKGMIGGEEVGGFVVGCSGEMGTLRSSHPAFPLNSLRVLGSDMRLEGVDSASFLFRGDVRWLLAVHVTAVRAEGFVGATVFFSETGPCEFWVGEGCVRWDGMRREGANPRLFQGKDEGYGWSGLLVERWGCFAG